MGSVVKLKSEQDWSIFCLFGSFYFSSVKFKHFSVAEQFLSFDFIFVILKGLSTALRRLKPQQTKRDTSKIICEHQAKAFNWQMLRIAVLGGD